MDELTTLPAQAGNVDAQGQSLRKMILEQNKGFAILQQLVVDNGKEIATIREKQDRVLAILDGDPSRDLKGLRTRVGEIEKTVEEWARWKLYLRGMAIGVALTGVTSIANLITLLAQIASGGLKVP